jgi:hypothetical protein
MKAIFAVSALAAAISAQALAADTEATTSFTGAMDAQFILNMQPDVATYDVDLKEDDYNYGISIDTAVVNGPFSGSIGLKSDEGTNSIEVGDLVVTDGMLSFGQVGSLMNTDQYLGSINEDMTESKLDVDVAFRYTISDEFKVQLQGLNDDAGTATGFAAAYKAEAGALAYAVEAEAYVSGPGADADLDPSLFAGAGVTYTSDVVKVLAALNYSQTAAVDAVATTEYAVAAESTVGPATVKASFQDFSTDVEKDEIAKVEVATTFDAITTSAGYKLTMAEEAGDELWAKAAYAADSYNASAKVILGEFDADPAAEPKIELRADTTSDAGVTYYAEFDFQTDSANQLTLGAKYSF